MYMNLTCSILPDTRIEIVPINSHGENLKSFQETLNLIRNEKIVAIIGDDNDLSTQTIALTAAANNVMHCVHSSASPSLSDKSSYPLTFRSQTIGTYQSRAILGLVKKFKVSNVAIMGSKDEIGINYVKSIQGYAPTIGIDASFAVAYNPNSASSMEEAFTSIINSGITTIILDIYGVAGDVFSVARRLNMLNGNFWIICTTGFDERLASFNLKANETDAFTGIWQVERPTPYDVKSEGETDVAKEFRRWYRDLYNLDAVTDKGLGKNFDLNWVTFSPSLIHIPSRCQNGTAFNISSTMTNILYELVIISHISLNRPKFSNSN
jgi:ABC-type branched-subunit amino acid transport system substrate-binding protein